MAFTKLQDRKCGNCVHPDSETYRAVKKVICYLKGKKDGEVVAMSVQDKDPGCNHWLSK